MDRIAFRDQFEESVRKASKCKEVNDLQWVPIEKYAGKVTLDRKKNLYKEIKNDKIAVNPSVMERSLMAVYCWKGRARDHHQSPA